MADGYIKIYRKFMDTSIYFNSQAVHLFLHLLLKANYKDRKIIFNNQTVELKSGQFITGRKTLAEETSINESKIYRLLDVFSSEGLIEQQTNRQYSIVTILNWNEYQESEQRMNNERTTDEQRMNTDKKDKKEKKDNNRSVFIKPTLEDVTQYCKERNNDVEPIKWLNFYESKGWMVGKNPMKNWKAAIITWETTKSTPKTNPTLQRIKELEAQSV